MNFPLMCIGNKTRKITKKKCGKSWRKKYDTNDIKRNVKDMKYIEGSKRFKIATEHYIDREALERKTKYKKNEMKWIG